MKQKMLIVTEALEMNGVLRSLLDFMSAMDKDRYDIYLFCFDAYRPGFVELPSYVKLLPEMSGCYMSRAPFARTFGWALRHFAFIMFARRLLCSLFQRFSPKFAKQTLANSCHSLKEKYDVAIAYSMGMTWRFVAEKVIAKKKLMWLHTDPRSVDQVVAWRRYKKYLTAASSLVCVSRGIKDVIHKFDESLTVNVATVHSVVRQDRIVSMVRKGDDKPRDESKIRIITVGRYSYSKNQKMIPQIAAKLNDAGVNFEWFVVGPLCNRAYKDSLEVLSRLGVGDKVIYCEGMENPHALVASCDIVVQPSIYEGWGLTVTEALCLQRYCIVSDIPSFREQVDDERRGSVVSLDLDSFVAAIIKAVETRCYDHVPLYDCPYTTKMLVKEFNQIIEM